MGFKDLGKNRLGASWALVLQFLEVITCGSVQVAEPSGAVVKGLMPVTLSSRSRHFWSFKLQDELGPSSCGSYKWFYLLVGRVVVSGVQV